MVAYLVDLFIDDFMAHVANPTTKLPSEDGQNPNKNGDFWDRLYVPHSGECMVI